MSRSGRFTHRVDRYAEAVLDGGILAGKLVRLACERHFRDRERAALGGWYRFSEAHADQILDFFEGVLRLPDVVDEDGDPQPFRLDVGTQFWAFVLGSGFGWVDDRNLRRIREWYIEAGKGTGKTPVLAGVGLYGMTMDGERAAEIYSAARDQDQASIMFKDAVRMAQASPDLEPELEFDGGAHIWQIRHPASLSSFRTFSRESGQKSGTRPHMGLLDELHEQPSPETSVMVRAGAKRRLQPIFAEITNSGYDRTSICWQRHEHSRRVLEQVVDDEQLLAYVCGLDEGDDPLNDETCWPKTNPYIGVSVSQDYLRRQVANAKTIPSETNNVLRLNFCIWTQQHTRGISMDQWRGCLKIPDESVLVASDCFGCLDLGETDDFTAWGRVWVLEDGGVAVKMRYFVPQSALERYPHRPYSQWERAGILTVTPGDVTDYGIVREVIQADHAATGMLSIAYDTKTARETAQILMGEGIDMIPIPQGFALNESIRKLTSLVALGKVRHDDDPILSWMADNSVFRDGPGGTKRLDKQAAAEKIDGIAALLNGIEVAVVRREREQTTEPQVFFVGGGATA
jgi:phage terminase large subunit-like protein